jgi:hypothetical protein
MNQKIVYTKNFSTHPIMQKYSLYIVNQAHQSLRNIVSYKIEYSHDIASAERFVAGFYEWVNTLSTLPHRGFNVLAGNKTQIYQNHLIIYPIQEPDKVSVLDIIDPKQATIASKYY